MGGYNKNSSNIVKYYYNLKQLIYILIYFEMQFKKKFCDGKAEFGIITPVSMYFD